MGDRSRTALTPEGDENASQSAAHPQPSSPGADAGGYAEVLRVAVPLILSTASHTLTLFVDRMFLSWYGQASVAAATPGGITYFTICSLFLGTAQYVNTIVAQHHGAGDKPACARAVWQGVFLLDTLGAPDTCLDSSGSSRFWAAAATRRGSWSWR